MQATIQQNEKNKQRYRALFAMWNVRYHGESWLSKVNGHESSAVVAHSGINDDDKNFVIIAMPGPFVSGVGIGTDLLSAFEDALADVGVSVSRPILCEQDIEVAVNAIAASQDLIAAIEAEKKRSKEIDATIDALAKEFGVKA